MAPGEKRTFPSEEEGYYPVIVETGISDTQNVEIVSGIQEGDEDVRQLYRDRRQLWLLSGGGKMLIDTRKPL